MAEQIEATRARAPEGGLWHERKDPQTFLTRPLILPRNQNSVLPLFSKYGLFGLFWILSLSSLPYGTSRKSLVLSKKNSIDQERRWSQSFIMHHICPTRSAIHSFGNTSPSLALFCKARWLQSHPGLPAFLEGHSPLTAANKADLQPCNIF